VRDRLAVLTVVWRKREYRAFLLIMVLLSLAVSSTLPLVTLYLVDNLRVSLPLVGLFFVAESLIGLILGLGVGRQSDRWHSRLPVMRMVAIWVAIGWLLFALSPYFWLDLLIGALFISVGSITMGQAFAALHDVMVRDAEPRPEFVNATVRTGFSLGFVLGPVIGSQLAAAVGFRAAFLVAAGLNLLCLAPLYGLTIPVSSEQREPSQQAPIQSTLMLFIFVGLCTFALIGDALRITYLPIDVTKHLGGSIGQYGTVVAISPLAELITVPAAGLLALKFGMGRLFTLGLLVATVEYVILSFNTALWQVYLTQAMDALVVAVVFGLGLTYAQQLAPGRAGLASSAFGSAFGIAVLVGNLIGGVSISLLGVPHIFLIPLATAAIALAAFLPLDRSTTHRV
jgi:SET family sugar efflux transporter-like MFS transporter